MTKRKLFARFYFSRDNKGLMPDDIVVCRVASGPLLEDSDVVERFPMVKGNGIDGWAEENNIELVYSDHLYGR